jgi:hypothetical protein
MADARKGKPIDKDSLDYFERRKGGLKQERETFIPIYRELADFIKPHKGRFFTSDRNKGDKKYNKIINSAATQSFRTARAGMFAGIMSPSRPWFTLNSVDPGLMEHEPVKVWLYFAERLMYDIFQASNLYNMAPTKIGEMLQFGTGVMLHVDDFQDVARFYTLTAGSYMIGTDHRQKVTTVCREYEMTVEQMVEEFTYERCSTQVQNLYDRGEYAAWVPVTEFIEPNPNFDMGSKRSDKKRFRSVKYETGCASNKGKRYEFLEQKGYDEFPAYGTRWEVTGEDIYGTDCPGITALGDIKGLQVQEKRKAQGIDKIVNPPLKGPAQLRNVPVSSMPGGLTIYDAPPQTEGLKPIYEVKPFLGDLRQDMNAVVSQIKDAFYVPLFQPISSMEGIQPKNIFELSQRHNEALLLLGPTLEGFHGEFLSPLIDRTFAQIVRAGLLPPAPPELQGKPLVVKYISTLAMAQRAAATGNIDRMASFIGGLVEGGLSDGLKFDGDQAIDEYASAIGVPPRIIRPDDVVAASRQQQQQRQAEAEALEAMNVAAKTAKDGVDVAKELAGV